MWRGGREGGQGGHGPGVSVFEWAQELKMGAKMIERKINSH